MDLTLYHYWRSTSSWRVRWALEHKGLKFKPVHVSLLDGESESAEHLKRNPLGYVPALDIGGKFLIESVAIIEWLEDNYPSPALYPKNSIEKAQTRALVEIINSDTQPIQNLTVLEKHSGDPEKRKEWARYFIERGLTAYQTLIKSTAGKFSVGDTLSVADIFLVPQVYGALRNDTDMSAFPIIEKIYNNALKTPSGQASHPDKYKPKD